MHERRKKGFAAWYYRVGTAAINHRWKVLAGSVACWRSAFFMSQLKTQFFPKDLSYLSYVDVWLPEDAPLEATNRADDARGSSDPRRGQRIWRASPGGRQAARTVALADDVRRRRGAALLVLGLARTAATELRADHRRSERQTETAHLVAPLQEALSAKVPEARIDVRQLEIGQGGRAAGGDPGFR